MSSSEEASVSLILPKHFYQTTAFTTLEGLAVVLGRLAAAYSIRVNQLQAKEAKLVALVEQRTQALSSSEKKFRQLAENIHEVFWMMDPRDRRAAVCEPGVRSVVGIQRRARRRKSGHLV